METVGQLYNETDYLFMERKLSTGQKIPSRLEQATLALPRLDSKAKLEPNGHEEVKGITILTSFLQLVILSAN